MFGSTWGNQNQQQQPANAFGQPSTFGSNTGANAFGAAGAFGQPQPQQQQQPPVNPMFGNLAAPSNPAPSGGFGAFGSTNSASNTAFGAPKPTTGFGTFGGGAGAFGSGGGFGQQTNTANTGTGIFGQPSTGTTSAFGSTTLFGGNKPTPAFGTTTASTVNTGTAGTPYAAFSEKDPTTSAMLQYQAITCMPAYRNFSFEELRIQDYAQNRKTAAAPAFGGSAFGSAQPSGTGLFGSQTTQPAQASIFGGTTNTPSGFGTFGSNTQASASQPSGGIFGGSAFAQQPQQPQPQQQQQQQTNAFGGFGQSQQPQQPQQQPSVFGGGSTFGGTAAKPAFGAFGTAGTAGGAFGGTGAFGTTSQPQQQQNTGLFGGTQPSTNTFGAFGSTQGKPSIFGGTTTQPSTSTGFGTFGGQGQASQQAQQPQQQQQQQQQPSQPTSLFGSTGGGLFGTATTQQPQQPTNQPTSLFGTQPSTGTGLFGSTGGGGLFGTTSTQQPQAGTQPSAQANTFGNIFGPKPAGSTLFGNVGQQNTGAAQPQTSLFGSSQSTTQPSFAGSLFGAKPTAPALGTSTSGQAGGPIYQPSGTSALNSSITIPGHQAPLTASIANPIENNVPIFSMLPPGPRLLPLDQSQQKKKSGFFVDSTVRSPVAQSGALAANKLRGFASTSSTMPESGFAIGKPNVLSITSSVDGRASIGPDGLLGRSASPALGSGTRQSIKKVLFDNRPEVTPLFIKTGSPGQLRGGRITFSPALSIAAREKDSTALTAAPSSALQPVSSTSPSKVPSSRNLSRFTANEHEALAGSETEPTLQEGDYWIKPDLATLKKASYDELSSFEGLVVGRKGYGEVHFLEPVDLTGLPKLGALLGDVIRFDDKECSVYPDSEDTEKPPPGSGLNVRARLILERCWAIDKATREPIKDESHPAAIKHLKRLKNMKDTQFESFDMDKGRWTFSVDHF